MPIYHVTSIEKIQHAVHYYVEANSSEQAMEYIGGGAVEPQRIEPSDYIETVSTNVVEVAATELEALLLGNVEIPTCEPAKCRDHWHCTPELATHVCIKPDRTAPCPTCGELPLKATREAAADKALADYDFSLDKVMDLGTWNKEDDKRNEWTCVLSIKARHGAKYRCGFIVRFKPGTAEVTEAYPGDPH